ncbi:hypothetical protein chiPu_0032200 [Chiloscyllium punctatum]|uniref:Uncharacterized protein n=1 Tax=Chiloscyllium punctatum TaxID=137246 RepID=A0A401TZT3_CHIPU|nr:hypothetical protein [Chiloscyllium punctatum]
MAAPGQLLDVPVEHVGEDVAGRDLHRVPSQSLADLSHRHPQQGPTVSVAHPGLKIIIMLKQNKQIIPPPVSFKRGGSPWPYSVPSVTTITPRPRTNGSTAPGAAAAAARPLTPEPPCCVPAARRLPGLPGQAHRAPAARAIEAAASARQA